MEPEKSLLHFFLLAFFLIRVREPAPLSGFLGRGYLASYLAFLPKSRHFCPKTGDFAYFRTYIIFLWRSSIIPTHIVQNQRTNQPVSALVITIFNGFKKACHTLYKFDSNTERTFAIVLENDREVLKWMRPSPKQFNIYYGPDGCSRYEPDFVVETADTIYMVETKASNELRTSEVQEKANAAQVYCNAASDWNAQHNGKPWGYALVSHDEVRLNSSFHNLMANRVPVEQLSV